MRTWRIDRRLLGLAAAAAAAVAVAKMLHGDDIGDGVATPVESRPLRAMARPAAPPAVGPQLRMDLLAMRGQDQGPIGSVDLFAARPGQQARAAALPASAPEPAKPPPFAYRYMGQLIDDGQRTVFLVKADRVLALRSGDRIDASYRVDTVGERELRLTHLPTGEPLLVPYAQEP